MTGAASIVQRAGVFAALAVGSAALVACGGSDASPLGNTQWQVSSVFDASDRPHQLPDSVQGRSFLVFGEDSFTGASGCVSLTGDLSWNDDNSEMSVGEVRSEPLDNAQCVPGDEDTADRLKTVMGNHKLKISRPSDSSLRMQQTGTDIKEWQTAPSVEFLSSP